MLDDGGDLVSTLHTIAPRAVLDRVRGGCEGTTTGVLRLRRMAADATLAFPMIAASDTPVTRIVDNTHGTAQSVIDGLLRASGVLLAGKTMVVAGFGACGAGIAESARALGARVVITEVDPVRALDAVLRGFRVLPIAEAAPLGEIFITATGSAEVITAEHLAVMRDGAVLANAGHFDVEIDVRALSAMAVAVETDVRPHADAYQLPDGRRLLLLAEGRVVNLVAADGHPPEVMDLAFGIEALALAWLAGNDGQAAARRAPGARGHRRRGRPPGPRRPRRPARHPDRGPAVLPGQLAPRLVAAALAQPGRRAIARRPGTAVRRLHRRRLAGRLPRPGARTPIR